MDKKVDTKINRLLGCQMVRFFCRQTDGQIDRETKKPTGRCIN